MPTDRGFHRVGSTASRAARGLAVAIVLAGCSQSSSAPGTSFVDNTLPPAITLLVPRSTSTVPGAVDTTTSITSRPGPQHSYPIDIFVASSYQATHHDYPAADMFADCGSKVVAPVTGTVAEVSRVDQYDDITDDPATRGGLVVSIIGVDQVRYYMAHLQEIEPSIEPGISVVAGQPVAKVGSTGKSSACHLHFGLSPVCSGPEWWVRRGVIWPARYLDAWRIGGDISPVQEITDWANANPGACTDPTLMPWPST